MDEKKRFFKAYYTNPIMFPHNMDDDLKRRRLNNYRYAGHIKGPGHAEKIAIYVSALTVDETLKLQQIFPEIPPSWVNKFIPQILCILTANSQFIDSNLIYNTIVNIIYQHKNANSSQLPNRLHAPSEHIDNHTCYQGGS